MSQRDAGLYLACMLAMVDADLCDRRRVEETGISEVPERTVAYSLGLLWPASLPACLTDIMPVCMLQS
jgi:hypothetical protein